MSRDRYLADWARVFPESLKRISSLPYQATRDVLIDLAETMASLYAIPFAEPRAAVSQELRRLFPAEWSQDAELARDEAALMRPADVTAEKITWVWWYRIPAGKITLLDGDPGLGKSVLTLDIAARITTGHLFPDGWATDPGEVLLLSAEDGLADTIRPRLEAAGADLSMVKAITGISRRGGRTTPPDIENDIPTIERCVHPETKLVIIDPLMAYLSTDTDAYRDHEVRRALLPLSDMASRTGVAVLLVRHLRKTSHAETALYAGGGSIGIAGAARSVLLIGKDPNDPLRRVLASVKSNLCVAPPSLAFRIEEDDQGRALLAWEDENATLTADDLIQGRKLKVKTFKRN